MATKTVGMMLITSITAISIRIKPIAYFSLVVTCSFAPLFLYLPVFYSDTFSIVCVPLLLYISSFIDMKKKRKKAERKKQIINNILLMILVSLVAFGGLKIKMTIIFVVIGIFADFFIKYGIKKTCEFASIFIKSTKL